MLEYVIELLWKAPKSHINNLADALPSEETDAPEPSEETSEGEDSTIQLATYDFDLGLSKGDKVWIKKDFETPLDKPFDFKAQVVKYEKVIIPGNKSQSEPDIFRIVITLEAVEKKKSARIEEMMKRLNS